jgi:hypothetical protein
VLQSGVLQCDCEELEAFRNAAKGHVLASRAARFNPETSASDRQLAERIKACCARILSLVSKRDVQETRLLSAREQTDRLPEPPKSVVGIIAAATGVFVLGFAPTIFSVFFAGLEDIILAWGISLILAAGMGLFLSLLIVGTGLDVAVPRLKTFALLLCVSVFVLRCARIDGKAGLLIGIGLTGIDCAVVEGLCRFAEKRQQAIHAYRNSRAQIVALEDAVAATIAQLADERARHEQLLSQLKQREAEAFDADAVANEAGWAVEAAYRAAIHANQRRLEGGPVEAFTLSHPATALSD